MKKTKVLYEYIYCNAIEYLNEGCPLFNVVEREVVEISNGVYGKRYLLKDYGPVFENMIDNENYFNMETLASNRYCATYWSLTKSDKVMEKFKKLVIADYERNIRMYFDKIDCTKTSIEVIENFFKKEEN